MTNQPEGFCLWHPEKGFYGGIETVKPTRQWAWLVNEQINYKATSVNRKEFQAKRKAATEKLKSEGWIVAAVRREIIKEVEE